MEFIMNFHSFGVFLNAGMVIQYQFSQFGRQHLKETE